jgi:hypothetical protein
MDGFFKLPAGSLKGLNHPLYQPLKELPLPGPRVGGNVPLDQLGVNQCGAVFGAPARCTTTLSKRGLLTAGFSDACCQQCRPVHYKSPGAIVLYTRSYRAPNGVAINFEIRQLFPGSSATALKFIMLALFLSVCVQPANRSSVSSNPLSISGR